MQRYGLLLCFPNFCYNIFLIFVNKPNNLVNKPNNLVLVCDNESSYLLTDFDYSNYN